MARESVPAKNERTCIPNETAHGASASGIAGLMENASIKRTYGSPEKPRTLVQRKLNGSDGILQNQVFEGTAEPGVYPHKEGDSHEKNLLNQALWKPLKEGRMQLALRSPRYDGK